MQCGRAARRRRLGGASHDETKTRPLAAALPVRAPGARGKSTRHRKAPLAASSANTPDRTGGDLGAGEDDDVHRRRSPYLRRRVRIAPASACDLSRGRWQRARGHLARRRRPADRHRSEAGRGQEAPALAAGALVEGEESARRVVLGAILRVADTPAGDIDRVGVDCWRRDRGEAERRKPERLPGRGGDRQHPGDGRLHGGKEDVSAQRR